jgi:hypothetical protein
MNDASRKGLVCYSVHNIENSPTALSEDFELTER